jgi:hypothetical protein
MPRVCTWIAVLLAAGASLAAAQTPATRVRGVIERVTDYALTVKTREGQTVTVRLNPNATVMAVTKASVSDIAPGMFVGAAAVRQPDGSLKAQEVLVFPEVMRGSGGGHYPWDLTPESTMTNATVESVVRGVDGPLLTLKYADGEVKVLVPPEAPVVTMSPADKSLLVKGAAVFIPATQAPGGRFNAGRVLVGKDGLVPPM